MLKTITHNIAAQNNLDYDYSHKDQLGQVYLNDIDILVVGHEEEDGVGSFYVELIDVDGNKLHDSLQSRVGCGGFEASDVITVHTYLDLSGLDHLTSKVI